MSDRDPLAPRGRRSRLPDPVGARTPGLDDPQEADGRRDGGPGDDTIERDWDRDDWDDEPNYLIRRMLFICAGLVVAAVVAYFVVRFVGGDDTDDSAETANSEWNSIVVLAADEIRVLDPVSGDQVDVFDAGTDGLDAQSMVAGNTLVTMTDEGRILMTDLADGSMERGRAGQDETLRPSPDNPTIAIVGSDIGGDITLVDTTRRETLSVADVAELDDPLIFFQQVRVNAAGTHAAMSDARSFQSVLIDIVGPSSELLAGQVVAIGDDRVVTAQPEGDNTVLVFYDLAGERIGSVDVPTPAATMLTASGDLLLVGPDGTVRRAGSDDVSDLGSILDDAGSATEIESGIAVAGGTRILVSTGDRFVVLDDDGTQLASASGQLTSSPTIDSRCVTIGSPRTTGSSVVLDTHNGAILTEIGGGIVAATSVDGCTAALLTADGPRIVHDGELIDVNADSVAAVAPDGSAFVVLDGRDFELITFDDDTTIEVADEVSVIRFAQR